MARFSLWCPELESALAEPFPKEWIKEKRQGGRPISFVSWHLYVHRLNDLTGPGWSMGEPILKEVGGKLVMGLPLTIFGVTRVNFGSEEEEHGNADEDGKVRDYGSAETNAFAQALKRTCALFGLGLSLYDKDGILPRQTAPRLTPKEREQSAMLEFIQTHGPRCSPELQDKIRTEWKQAKKVYAVAATLAGLVEEATGEQFKHSPAAV